VTTLHRKLVRELWLLRGQVVSIALVIAASVSIFVALWSSVQSLDAARDAHYEDQRFADVFAELRRAPRSLADRIRSIPGVGEVEVRVTADVRLEVAGSTAPIVGRLISIPREGSPRLDRPLIRRGRAPEPGHRDEVLISEAFAEAHKLVPGDALVAVIDGHRAELRVAGVALSPEFVLAVRAGEIMPDDHRFGIVWMNEAALARALDLDGAFDSVTLALAPGASEPAVLAHLDALLAPYGGSGAYGRADQSSHRGLTAKLTQLAVQAKLMPAMFLGVAAFLLNTVLTRLIGTQRSVIATLKAFGYGRGAVVAHYLELVTAIVLLGAALGVALGASLGVTMIRLYRPYYRFPSLAFHLDAGTVLIAVLVSLAASLGGALSAVLHAAALAPAEAMRPEAPKTFHPAWIERILGPLLAPRARMVLRQLARRPVRAALGVAGIAFAVAIMVMSGFFSDSIDRLIAVQFNELEREDLTVLFRRPVSGAALHELERLPGVFRVEPQRATAARLIAGPRSRRTALQGVAPGDQLRRLLDVDLRPVALPDQGVVLTRELGEALGVGPGDALVVEILEGSRPTREVRVAGLADELIGTSAYMSLAALERLLGEQGSLTSAHLTVDSLAVSSTVRRLEAMPAVSSVGLRRAMLTLFRDEIKGRMGAMAVVLGAFASVIAVGVVYNGARITLAERGHELGCMRVMGFTRAEVSSLLVGELALQVAAAIPLGCVLGRVVAGAMARGLASDAFRFPVVVEPRSYAWAALIVTIAAALSALAVRRKLDEIDLADVLRTRE
jgi:putative ABC transport system permease protein